MRNENNRKRARKERGFLSGFVLVIHVQSGLDGGEFALVDQTSRGQRIAMKEVTACKRENKTWLGTHIRTKQSILVCEFWLQTRNAWTTQSLLNTNQQQLCGADGKGEIAACRPSPRRKISIYIGTTSHWGAPGSAGKARPTAASCHIPAQSDRNRLPKAWTRCLIPQIERVPSAVPCWRPGHGAGGPARPLGLVLRHTSPLPQCLCNMKLTFQIRPPPTHLEVLQGFASIHVLLPSTAFHMHEQPCCQLCSQITQVKSEQGWGKPEVRTVPCFWFTASQNQRTLLGALCPAPCMAAIFWKEAPTHFLTKNHEDPALFSKCWR